MNIKLIIISFIFFIVVIPCILFANDTNNNIVTIHNKLDQCIENYPSTVGQIDCIDIALKDFDKKLNTAYKELINSFDQEGKEALRQSQRKWIQFRDSEIEFLGHYYRNFSGTMYSPMHAHEILSITSKRAQELQNYLDFLKEHGEEQQ
ncbi:hypothetical protein MASR1M90_20830 [Desulfovibrionales bacterium]